MPRIETGWEHQLAYRQRFSRGFRLLGCAVFLAGAMLAASPVLLTAGELVETERTVAVLGGLLASAGLALLLARRGKLFDREEQTVTFWQGFGWRWHEAVYDLRGFANLVVRPGFHPSEPWEVSLGGPSGERLTIFRLPHESAAQRAASEIAGFLNLPIVLAPPEPPPEPANNADAAAPVTAAEPLPATPVEKSGVP
jgi:hypothetical protein